MKASVKEGTLNVSVVIRIVDSTTLLPEVSVEHNTSGIDLWYRRDVDPGSTPLAKVSITEAALAALTTAHADGGIEHIGDGYYRLDLPDAAFAAGAIGVQIGGTVTGMMVEGAYYPIVAYDPMDTVRAGLTALPNAAADAAGGLPISDDGGVDMDLVDGLTGARVAVLTDWINAGRLDAILDLIKTAADAIKVNTDKMTWTVANELNANTKSINDAEVIGDGNATPWDGV